MKTASQSEREIQVGSLGDTISIIVISSVYMMHLTFFREKSIEPMMVANKNGPKTVTAVINYRNY